MDNIRREAFDRVYDALGVLAKSSEYGGLEYHSLRVALNHVQEAEMACRKRENDALNALRWPTGV